MPDLSKGMGAVLLSGVCVYGLILTGCGASVPEDSSAGDGPVQQFPEQTAPPTEWQDLGDNVRWRCSGRDKVVASYGDSSKAPQLAVIEDSRDCI